MTTIPERLKMLRKEAKLTQADVAKFLNISESAYGYYEQGRNEISISNLKKLAKKYDVSIDYISCESNIRKSYLDKDDEEFEAFANNPELNVFYKELPNSDEEAVERLRQIWEIIKKDYHNKK